METLHRWCALLLVLALLGCSEGEGGTNRPAPPEAAPIDLSSAELTLKTTFSEDDVLHFLNRTHFGVREEDLQHINEIGMDAYLDERLNFHLLAPVEYSAAAQITSLTHPEWDDASRWWLHIMTRTENPLQESVALFWHDHFGVSQDVLDAQRRRYILDHINLLRREGAGNLRQFLLDVATDPAMLEFLDGVRSPKRAPNENFAREFWELFTLGVDNGYTQDDIVEAARAFTGFRSRTDVRRNLRYVEYDEERHDSENKTIFGRTLVGRSGADGVNEYMDVVNITLEERPVAEFICRKVFEWFAYTDPEQGLIDDMASQLRAERWELAPVFKTLFLSEAFYSPRAKQGLVKSPIDYAVGLVRTTGLEIPFDTLSWRTSLAGQKLAFPPSVNGWPNGRLWLSADSTVQRANILQSAIVARDYQTSLRIDLDRVMPPEGQRMAGDVVDHLARIMRVELGTSERDACLEYLNTTRNWNGDESADPFDASNPEHLDERVRGLIWILGQHPDYNIK